MHRKLLNWEWYHDSKVVHLFLHLVLQANHQEKKWKGITIKRGQLVTGRKSLSLQTGISEQSIRTSLKKLKSTNEITIKPTNRFSLITVCQYDTYNNNECDTNQPNNQQTPNKQPTTNQQLTTNKNVKKDKNEKKQQYMDFVFLTVDEHQKLTDRFGEQDLKEKISSLNEYIGKIGEAKANKKYSSHYFTILSWARKNGNGKKIERPVEQPKEFIR